MSKKLFLVFTVFTLHFTPYTLHYLYAGWPINRTPAIEGKVVDATTGEPIENVVIVAVWYKKEYWKPSFGGTPSAGFSKEIIITDKEGKYKIPSKTSIHIFTGFDDIRINICHPLYEGKFFGVVKEGYDERDPEKIEMVKKYGYMLWGYGTDIGSFTYTNKNTIHYDIQLLSLEERYVKVVNSKLAVNEELENRYGEFLRFLEGRSNGGYFLTLKNRKIEISLEQIMDKWDKINSLFKDKVSKEWWDWGCERIEKVKRKIYEVIYKYEQEHKK